MSTKKKIKWWKVVLLGATPLFDWGKYYEKEGHVRIPISIQAHHSFVDGIHIGQFVEKLQGFFDEC